jgi:hypothetical protein
VRLWLSVIAYDLGNLRRRLVVPSRLEKWSLTSLRQRLVKKGGRLVRHARYHWLLLAEGHLHRRLFGHMLRRIWALRVMVPSSTTSVVIDATSGTRLPAGFARLARRFAIILVREPSPVGVAARPKAN